MARKRNLYEPGSDKPFRLSRTKVELFIDCPRCFYLDIRLGVSRPRGFPFNLNSAVDVLLKREFDHYRREQIPHPYMAEHGINAVPYQHDDLDTWRANFTGVSRHHRPTNLELFGAVDDVWVSDDIGELIVVDYKATSKKGEVSLDADWQITYKRQMEFYQWLLRGAGFKVSDTGYFVYCNGIRDGERFDARLDFKISLIAYTGSDGWVASTIQEIHETLQGENVPEPSEDCEHCAFVSEAAGIG